MSFSSESGTLENYTDVMKDIGQNGDNEFAYRLQRMLQRHSREISIGKN